MSDTQTMPSDLGKTNEPESDPDIWHLANIGRLIEACEDHLRNEVTDIYVGKQRHITNTGRLLEEYMTKDEKMKF